MGEKIDSAAGERVEAIRGQAHKVLEDLLGRPKRKRRLERIVVFLVGVKVGALITALAGAWWWYRGGREL
jgi:hypothetical protein